MKLLIKTKVHINRGTPSSPLWQDGDEEVYILEDVPEDTAESIKERGIAGIASLIESTSMSYMEFVVGWTLHSEAEQIHLGIESPTFIHYSDGRWHATRTVRNGADTRLPRDKEVILMTEEYQMMRGGGRGNYRAFYTLANGDHISDLAYQEKKIYG